MASFPNIFAENVNNEPTDLHDISEELKSNSSKSKSTKSKRESHEYEELDSLPFQSRVFVS